MDRKQFWGRTGTIGAVTLIGAAVIVGVVTFLGSNTPSQPTAPVSAPVQKNCRINCS